MEGEEWWGWSPDPLTWLHVEDRGRRAGKPRTYASGFRGHVPAILLKINMIYVLLEFGTFDAGIK